MMKIYTYWIICRLIELELSSFMLKMRMSSQCTRTEYAFNFSHMCIYYVYICIYQCMLMYIRELKIPGYVYMCSPSSSWGLLVSQWVAESPEGDIKAKAILMILLSALYSLCYILYTVPSPCCSIPPFSHFQRVFPPPFLLYIQD